MFDKLKNNLIKILVFLSDKKEEPVKKKESLEEMFEKFKDSKKVKARIADE